MEPLPVVKHFDPFKDGGAGSLSTASRLPAAFFGEQRVAGALFLAISRNLPVIVLQAATILSKCAGARNSSQGRRPVCF